jgi:hypothetical protein
MAKQRGRPKSNKKVAQVGLRYPVADLPDLDRAVELDAKNKGILVSRNNFCLDAVNVAVRKVLRAAGGSMYFTQPE